MKPKYLFAVAVLAMAPIFAQSNGCNTTQPANKGADAHQAAETAKALAEADRQVGMPDITRFTERKLARDLLELRDKEIATYTYLVNLNGELIFLGESVGYGLPYSVQFTNPEKFGTTPGGEFGARNPYTMPQADPNGLFMPGGLSATWVMLVGPDGTPHPVYVEQELLISPFPLHTE